MPDKEWEAVRHIPGPALVLDIFGRSPTKTPAWGCPGLDGLEVEARVLGEPMGISLREASSGSSTEVGK